jgi:hypothetical protein
MITRELSDPKVVSADQEALAGQVNEVSPVSVPVDVKAVSDPRVAPEDAEEFAKFKARRDVFKAEFAKFKMYRQRANELNTADVDHGHVNSPVTP